MELPPGTQAWGASVCQLTLSVSLEGTDYMLDFLSFRLPGLRLKVPVSGRERHKHKDPTVQQW